MAKQTILLGSVPSGVGGDTPRSGWTKAISNFDELYRFNAIDEAPGFTGNIDDGSSVPLGQCTVTPNTGGTKPAGVNYGLLVTLGAVGQQGRMQTLYEINGATGVTLRIFYRNNYAGSGTATFGAWQRIYTQNCILGTVSQSGGLPTGAIMESGSNANGSYTKYADGRLICEMQNGGYNGMATAIGSMYISSSIPFTFPVAFSATPKVLPFAANSQSTMCWGAVQNAGPVNCNLVLFSAASNGAALAGYLATGRWF